MLSCVTAVLAGCHNPRYCAGNPDDDCDQSWDAAIVLDTTPAGCVSDPQCHAPTAVCDIPAATCVQCTATEPAACTTDTPTCGSDDACHACRAHGDCASNACLPTGSCGDDTNVAYVDPAGTDNTMCTQAMPCTAVAKALATSRAYVKFHGTTSEAVTINNQNVTLLADPSAQLTSSTAGVILKVDGTSQLTIYDLEIANGLGSTGIGISMPSGNAATLVLSRVSITGNAGGGISISGGQFDISNCMITGNGGGGATLGGVKIDGITGAGTYRFQFNTITANLGPATVNTGVSCGTVLSAVPIDSNIIYANVVSGGGTQIGGSANCMTTYSDVGPDTVAGTGNLDSDPLFVDAADNNFHITSASPCKDTADPAATLAFDFDNDARPQGPRSDIGADEYKP